MRKLRTLLMLFAALLLTAATALGAVITVDAADYPVKEDGWYDGMQEVAVYLTLFEELPDNYLTKDEARDMGWVSSRGNLWDVAYGCSIGGDRFGNYEGILPDARGRNWTECDIDFGGGRRGAKRIVFSNDGLIYYTDDHYESFDEICVVFTQEEKEPEFSWQKVVYGECYTDWQDVASYIYEYGELPINYIPKTDAYELGFVASKDNMGDVAPEFSIGGDEFQNREGLLPEKRGRVYYECDVNMIDGRRGSCRIVYSNDGLIYYTQDKYKSFMPIVEE